MQNRDSVRYRKFPSNVLSFILLILYKVFLDIVYVFIISPIYDYSGHIVDIVIEKYLLSWLYLFLIAIFIPKGKDKVSYMVLQLHTLIMIIPVLTIYGLANLPSEFMLMIVCCFVFQIIFLRCFRWTLKFPLIKNGKYLFIILISLSTIFTYASLIYANGIHLEAINFFNVYKLRENIVFPFGFLEYFAAWQYRIINPYMIISSYAMNKKGLFRLFIGLQVLLYFVIPYKEIFLSVFLIIGVSVILKRFNFMVITIYGIIGTIIVSILINLAKISLMPLAIVPTRLLFEPASIKFQHFKVFSMELEKLYYSEGLIGKIMGLNYPYNQPTGYIVNSYFGEGNSNSNTGYLAYAYDNLGLTGMIIMSFLFVIILWLIDSLSVYLNKNLVFSLVVYQMFMLNDGDLLTLLLTGGLFLSICILLLDQESFKAVKKLNKSMQNKEKNLIKIRKLSKQLPE